MTPLSFPILTQLPSILALALMTMACPRSLAHEIDENTLQMSPEESSATWLPWNLSESWEEKHSSQCWKYLIPESQSEIQVHLEEHDTVINALHCVSCIHKPQSRSRYSLCSGSSTSSIQFPVWQGGESWVSAVNLSLAADKNILYLSCLLSRLERQTNWQTY